MTHARLKLILAILIVLGAPTMEAQKKQKVQPHSEPVVASLTKEDCNQTMQQAMRAQTSEERISIFNDFKLRINDDNKHIGEPTLKMIVLYVVQSLAEEKKEDRIEQYVAILDESLYKRDIYFSSGSKSMENNRIAEALPLLQNAVRLTLELQQKGQTIGGEEEKRPVIFGLYAGALIKAGQTDQALPFAKKAFDENSKNFSFINSSYATALIHAQKYVEARPIIETLMQQGLSTSDMEEALLKAYTQEGRSEEESQKKVVAHKSLLDKRLGDELSASMIKVEAPLFNLTNLKGESVNLADLKGKVVIIDFWATWCGSCKASFPAMQMALDKYKSNSDVVFLFINTLDNKKDIKNTVNDYMTEKGFTFNVLFDEKQEDGKGYKTIAAYGGKGIPVKYVIDRDGFIRIQLTGYSGSDEKTVDELSRIIDMLL